MSVDNYHGLITCHFANKDSNFRPFVFGGFGATRYAPSPRDDISFNDEESSRLPGGRRQVLPGREGRLQIEIALDPDAYQVGHLRYLLQLALWVLADWPVQVLEPG
jgi:hypothetical protein